MKWKLKALLFAGLLLGCDSSPSDLISRAEKEALNQRSQVAEHLYLTALKNHTTSDALRLRALIGLARLSFNQLHDYTLGMRTVDQILKDYTSWPTDDSEMRSIRLQASEVARLQMQNRKKAFDLIEPYSKATNLSLEENHEIGRTLITLGEYESADGLLKRAWDQAVGVKACDRLKRLQLDILEVYGLLRKCEDVFRWTEVQFPEGCEGDRVSVLIEKAHCLELQGAADSAIKIYQELVARNPENSRIHFLLKNLKKRMKEKQMR